ncbi:hypothetical protein HMY34_17350 [Thiothrix subterranea]|uniref:hypothetical protein n=1 Tax=Thiothrix subterranea TaxID=2735563 RepID=UPI00192BDA50|nr:hypothetical protein [Thiothrix subterranea]QQZ30379.1 hypothetical protein HMY34_17350 [Thiothrix subterranea]
MVLLSNLNSIISDGGYSSISEDKKIQFWVWYIHAAQRNWIDACSIAGISSNDFYLTKNIYALMADNESNIDNIILDVMYNVVTESYLYPDDFIEKSFLNLNRVDLLESYQKKYEKSNG